jgi:hypothetical protein
MDRERPRASDSEDTIPEAWIGQEVMIETTESLSSDLRASAPVYLEDVNDRGVVMLVTRHRDQNQFSRYFYPWSVVGWIRLERVMNLGQGRQLPAAGKGKRRRQSATPHRLGQPLVILH